MFKIAWIDFNVYEHRLHDLAVNHPPQIAKLCKCLLTNFVKDQIWRQSVKCAKAEQIGEFEEVSTKLRLQMQSRYYFANSVFRTWPPLEKRTSRSGFAYVTSPWFIRRKAKSKRTRSQAITVKLLQ